MKDYYSISLAQLFSFSLARLEKRSENDKKHHSDNSENCGVFLLCFFNIRKNTLFEMQQIHDLYIIAISKFL